VTLRSGRRPIEAHPVLLSFFQQCSDARCHPSGHLRIWLTSPWVSPLAPGVHPLPNLLSKTRTLISGQDSSVPFYSLFPRSGHNGERPQIAHGPGHKKLKDEPSSLHSTRVPFHIHLRLTHARRIPFRLFLLLLRPALFRPSHILAHLLSPSFNTVYLHPHTRRARF